MNGLFSQSFIIIPSFRSAPKVYESQLINILVTYIARLLLRFKNSNFGIFISHVYIKRWLLFLFILFLSIVPSSDIQLSSFPSQDTVSGSILNERQFGIPIFSPSSIVLFFLVVFFFAQYIKRKVRLKFWDFEVLLLCFLVIVLLSSLVGINLQASLVWILRILFGFVIYFIFSRLILGKKDMQIITYAILTVIFVNTFVALFQMMRGGLLGLPFENIREFASPSVILHFQETEYFRIVGLLSQPNKLSAYLAFLVPITLLGWFSKNRYTATFSKLATLACVILPVFALSRWGLISVIFAIVATLAIFLKMKKIRLGRLLKITKFGVIILVLMVVIAFSNQTIVKRFSYFSPDDKSLSARLELFSQSMFMIRENPFLGVGGGNFTTYLINYDMTKSHISGGFPAPVQSLYFLLASEIGFIGLFLLLIAIARYVKFFLTKFENLTEDNKVITVSLFVSFITFFFNNIWTINSFDNRGGFLFWMLFGLLVNIMQKSIYFTKSRNEFKQI